MFSRIKSKISSISSGRSPPSSMHTSPNNDLQLGLKTLIIQTQQPESHHHHLQSPANRDQKILHSHSRVLNHYSSPSEQALDDIIIGTDSGVHILTDSDYEEMSNRNLHVRSFKHTGSKMHRHYPPPMPMVAARRGNLVMTRHNEDGRLVLKGHRAQHHQFLECHRQNGRLIVNLVTRGGGNDGEKEEYEENHEFEAVVEEENALVQQEIEDDPSIESDHDRDELELELELNSTSIRDRVWSSISDELSYLESELSRSLGCNNTNIIHESHPLYLSQSPGSSSSPLRPMTSVIN